MGTERRSRRWKGPRVETLIRVPQDHRAVYERLAAEANMPLGDYLVSRLADDHDLDPPAYLARNRDQEELPVAG